MVAWLEVERDIVIVCNHTTTAARAVETPGTMATLLEEERRGVERRGVERRGGEEGKGRGGEEGWRGEGEEEGGWRGGR